MENPTSDLRPCFDCGAKNSPVHSVLRYALCQSCRRMRDSMPSIRKLSDVASRPNVVRERKPFELEARQCILRSETSDLDVKSDRREDNGSMYCGRPRQASARHAHNLRSATGAPLPPGVQSRAEVRQSVKDRQRWASQYPWQG